MWTVNNRDVHLERWEQNLNAWKSLHEKKMAHKINPWIVEYEANFIQFGPNVYLHQKWFSANFTTWSTKKWRPIFEDEDTWGGDSRGKPIYYVQSTENGIIIINQHGFLIIWTKKSTLYRTARGEVCKKLFLVYKI